MGKLKANLRDNMQSGVAVVDCCGGRGSSSGSGGCGSGGVGG
jgi:hypothetical protein